MEHNCFRLRFHTRHHCSVSPFHTFTWMFTGMLRLRTINFLSFIFAALVPTLEHWQLDSPKNPILIRALLTIWSEGRRGSRKEARSLCQPTRVVALETKFTHSLLCKWPTNFKRDQIWCMYQKQEITTSRYLIGLPIRETNQTPGTLISIKMFLNRTETQFDKW